ncbi:MAG: hypothetical protein WCK83_05840, partial [Burkholderiales bacterium]
ACLQAIGRKTIASRLAPTNPSLAISPVIARPRPPYVIARPKAVAIHDFVPAWIAALRSQ